MEEPEPSMRDVHKMLLQVLNNQEKVEAKLTRMSSRVRSIESSSISIDGVVETLGVRLESLQLGGGGGKSRDVNKKVNACASRASNRALPPSLGAFPTSHARR